MLTFIKMRKNIYQNIRIPEDIEVKINGDIINVKGPQGENSRKFNLHKLELYEKDSKIFIGSKKATKKEKKRINTITAHIKNMMEGVQNKFVYELKVVSAHFPITLEKKDGGILIKNFLGEKVPRKAKIPAKAEVEIQKDIVKISSVDKEIAGQTAANIEKTTRIRNRDRRIFQDGIFITNKSGKEI